MKTNYYLDYIMNADSLADISKLSRDPSIAIIQRDSLSRDSIQATDKIHRAEVKSVPKYGGENISRFKNIGVGNDWLIGVLLASLFLLTAAKFLFGKYLSKLVESIFNFRTGNNLFLDKNINMAKGSAIVNFMFVVNISMFAINIMNYNANSSDQIHGFKEFILILSGLVLLYLGKIVVIRSLGYIFKASNDSKEYLFTTFLYNKNLGLFLFPVIIGLPFVQPYVAKSLINIGLLMVFFFFILRIARGLKILFRKHVSIFYMILYLCALEIFPLLMIYKLLVG